jgi:hypothetical protein
MKWVTRENAKVDRIACPWLIRRFVDPHAEFLFVPAEQVRVIAEREGAMPFDTPDAELGHVEGRCSFESIVLKYGLTDDPALAHIAAIVHAADVEPDVDSVPEGRGLKAVAFGLAYLHGADDRLKLDLQMPVYDALYAWCQRMVAESRTS